MTDKLELTKDGLVGITWENGKYVRGEVEDIFSVLRLVCEFDETVTLKTIFNLVDKFFELKDFIKSYSWCPWIEEFHEQAKLPFVKKDIERLELSHVAQVSSIDNELDIYQDFYGVGTSENDNFPYKVDDTITYSVSCTPMNHLSELPIKLVEQYTIYKDFTEEIGTFNKPFSLLEILECIYFDISFYGGPADNENLIEKMNCIIDEVESGKVECIPLDKALDKIKRL